jgi:transcriptional regulator with XRE-family HTH domain
LDLIGKYKKNKNLEDYQLAEELGVLKGYVSQILHATFDHKISKVADLALACNVMPLIYFVDMDQFIKDDARDKEYVLVPVTRCKNLTKNKKKDNQSTTT